MAGRVTSPTSVGNQVREAVSLLRRGGVVAYPTDTVYGLGADPRSSDAVRRIYRVKAREAGLALPVLASSVRQAGGVAVVSPLALFLAGRFWPGALTLVLPRQQSFPAYITAGGNTVAVRVPAHPVPRALARGLGTPVVGTSANVSGEPAAVTASEVKRQLGETVDFVVDGGRCPGGVESTVLDLTVGEPAVLRQGAIPSKAISDALAEFRARGS